MSYRQSLTLIAAVALAVALTTRVDLHGQGAATARPSALAAVDIEQVFSNLDEKAAIEAEITSRTEALQKEEQQRQTELKALQADLEILSPESDAYQQTQLKMEQKAIEFRTWREFKRRQLEAEKALRIEGLYRKVIDAIGRAAQKGGYDVVLFKDRMQSLRGQNQQQLAALIQVRKVLYISDELDITDQITQMMNNEYNN